MTMADGECNVSNCDEAIGLLMTYRCNLDCQYCYIKTKRSKDMTLEKAQQILEPFLMKGNKLDIIFVGGETLLAINVIIPLVEWVRGKEWRSQYRFFGSTNGSLLTPKIKKWLTQNKDILTLGLSYDGIPVTQLNNRGNNNIDLDYFIRTWPYQPIQMTINAKSVSKMAEGIIYLLDKGAAVHPNVAFEDKEWDDEDIIEYGRQLNRLIPYYMLHKDAFLISQFSHNLNEYAGNINRHKEQREMCGAGQGYQVFDTDGISYPCHILSPLVLKGSKLQRIKEGLLFRTESFADERCITCPYTSSCPTCMACNYLYRGCFQKRDSTHCRIMRTEVRACIKMEVQRLKQKKELAPSDATLIDSIQQLLTNEKWQDI